jgi:hypothetical protein
MKPIYVLILIVVLTSSAAFVVAQDIQISVVPEHVYKLSDSSKLPTESWMFYILLTDKLNRTDIRPLQSRIDLISGGKIVSTSILPQTTLTRMQTKRFTIPAGTPAHAIQRAYARDESFDLRYAFPQIPIAWKIDRVRLILRLALADKAEIDLTKEIPIETYVQKTILAFPLKGPAIITQGMWNNGGHSGYGNQYAIDVMGLTPNYAAMLRESDDLEANASWGREIFAPADGTVVYARNDVPDNAPGVDPESVFSKLRDPISASAGNAVIISHGNSEYSVVMHMQKGSVRLVKDQPVKRGDLVGRIGCSGDCFGPHLHFQFQTGAELFRYASLPVVFDNVKSGSLTRGSYFNAK